MKASLKIEQEQSIQEAIALAQSVRGQWIMGQALHYAIIALEKIEKPYREISNIADMKLLRDNLFPMFSASVEATEKFKKKV